MRLPLFKADAVQKTANVRLKPIALPAQHGGWGFVLEPIVLGLLVAPSWAGVWLGVAALGVFLMHQPIRLLGKDVLKRQRYPRTIWALRFAGLYGGIAVTGFGLALMLARNPFLVALVCATPLALFQLWHDIRGEGRTALAELAGSLTFGSIATALALMQGWEAMPAFALWAAVGARAFTSILYVRGRLRLNYGQPAQPGFIAAVHLVVGCGLLGLVGTGWLSWGVLIGFGLLTARMVYGLWLHPAASAKQVGFQEIAFGLVFVILTAVR